MGNPLWILMTAAASSQPTAVGHAALRAGDGSCHTGERMTRCGTSRRPIWYFRQGIEAGGVVRGRARRHAGNVVVVVERKAIPVVGVEVRLPDLIVLQHAVGVAGAAAEAARLGRLLHSATNAL